MAAAANQLACFQNLDLAGLELGMRLWVGSCCSLGSSPHFLNSQLLPHTLLWSSHQHCEVGVLLSVSHGRHPRPGAGNISDPKSWHQQGCSWKLNLARDARQRPHVGTQVWLPDSLFPTQTGCQVVFRVRVYMSTVDLSVVGERGHLTHIPLFFVHPHISPLLWRNFFAIWYKLMIASVNRALSKWPRTSILFRWLKFGTLSLSELIE